jgi:predicted AlkP superfamily phosphohydrolase/phosphomutase
MKNPVIAIGLDAADPLLVELWMSQGHLKNLNYLRERGAYTRLNNFDYYRAETPWTTFLTGCSPHKTGYWSPVKLHEGTYKVNAVDAYDFQEYPPFYALGDDYRVAVFDMPQSILSNQVNGVQLLAWGAHSPQTPSHSRPTSLFQELTAKYGEHPAFDKDYAETRDLAALHHIQKSLEVGISRRSAICQDLLQREPWDLFLTVFGEPHSAGHLFWHLSQPEHPLYKSLGSRVAGDPLLEVYEAMDKAIGEILSKAPENASVIVFAPHGMGTNVMDLPSTLFLPELLYRFSFPGRVGIAPGELGAALKQPMSIRRPLFARTKRGWDEEVWSLRHDPNAIRSFLRQEAPVKLFKLLEPLFGTPLQSDLLSHVELREQSDAFWYQSASWYQQCWPQMKAFALPSFSEGYVRVNLQGREPQGIVAPSEYNALCDELSQLLYRLKDGRTGQPMVKEIIRTRQDASDRDPKLPDADLVVIWQDNDATDVVESPDLGQIGPVPHLRTGSHRARGFCLAQGPDITPGSSLPVGHALDLAPTILNLMGAPVPKHCEGKPLLETPVLVG